MNTFDNDKELDFFADQPTRGAAVREGRPRRPQRAGPRRPAPPGAVELTRLAGFVALAIAVVIGLVFWVGSCQGQSKHDEYASYLASIAPLAQSSAQVGKEFATEIGMRSLSVADFEAKLQEWSTQQQQDYIAAQRIQPPAPLQTAHAEILATFQLRALGLAGIADTLAQAKASSPRTPAGTAASELAGQAQLLRSSDIVWVELFRLPATETLGHLNITGVIVPSSQLVSNPNVFGIRSFTVLYQRLGTGQTSGGGGRTSGPHGSDLLGTQAVNGGTAKTLSRTTHTTVAVSSGLVVNVTFLDSGNFPEVQVPVTLKVIVAGHSVYSHMETVASILAKHQATVSFSNLQVPPAAFGQSASISVKIGQVPGEVRLDNNSATYPVFFSLASG